MPTPNDTWYAINQTTPNRATVCDPSETTLVWHGPAGHEIGDRIWHGAAVARTGSTSETQQIVSGTNAAVVDHA